MINIGQKHKLKVVKLVGFGAYLDAENLGELLLPRKHMPRDLSIGEFINVFIYLDSEDRLVATTQEPKASVGEFAYLEMIDSNDVGAFLEWGLDKHLLIPFAEQHRPLDVGKSYLVYLYVNDIDGRIVASSKVNKFIDDEKPHNFTPQQSVNLIIANSTDLGFKAIINHSHWGVLYKNDVHERLSFGQYKSGYIKHVRPDNRIDLSLQCGDETRDKYAQVIENYLIEQNGFAPLHAKTDPKLISKTFGMSKSSFKKTIGGLYKQRIINITKEGISLIEK